jgi:hypothetical protein
MFSSEFSLFDSERNKRIAYTKRKTGSARLLEDIMERPDKILAESKKSIGLSRV